MDSVEPKRTLSDAKKMPGSYFFASDLPDALAVTDLGREIPLFHYHAAVLLEEGEQYDLNNEFQRRELFSWAQEQFLANKQVDGAKLIRLNEPFLEANCHGWAFAGGQFGIKDEHIPGILADHAYVTIADPRDGDLAVYWDGNSITHTGIVRCSPEGEVLLESKWGPFCVFRHAPGAFSFPGCVREFYRSSRNKHGLVIRLKSR